MDYPTQHGPATIAAITASGYRAHATRLDRIEGAMPVMGMRVFYGRRRDGAGVAQFYLTGRAFRTAEAKARLVCDLLWDAALTGETWEVYGQPMTVTAKIDLSPVETTRLALRFRAAMGR